MALQSCYLACDCDASAITVNPGDRVTLVIRGQQLDPDAAGHTAHREFCMPGHGKFIGSRFEHIALRVGSAAELHQPHPGRTARHGACPSPVCAYPEADAAEPAICPSRLVAVKSCDHL